MVTEQQVVNTVGNTTALGALGGWIVGVLPSIATLLTVIWFAILITEKVTGKPFVELVRCAAARVKSWFK